MKRKETIRIIRKKFEKLNRIYRSMIIHFDPEDIHDFRVEVKKLKAFLRLTGITGAASGNASGKELARLRLPRKLRELYRITGNIRNLQLQQQHIRKACLTGGIEFPDHYLYVLSTGAATQVMLADYLVRGKKSFKKEERRIVANLPIRPGKKADERYLRMHTKKIGDLLTPLCPTDEVLHSIRKNLKDLQYTSTYTERYNRQPGFLPQQSGYLPLTYPEIGSFTSLLGDLQDLCIGIDLLQPAYINRGNSEKEKKILRDLRGQWLDEKSRKQEEIYVQLKEKFQR